MARCGQCVLVRFSRAAQVVVVLLFFAASGGAAAQPPPIVFVDQRPLSVGLAQLRKQGELRVPVRNTTDAAQMVTLRVVDLAPAAGERDLAIDGLFAASGVTETVVGGGEETLELPVQLAEDARPRKGTYNGLLTLAAARGDLDRREVGIKVVDVEHSPAQGSSLAADGLPDITLSATNFIPSILTPLGPLFLVFAVLALILTLVFWGSLGPVFRWVAVLVALAVGMGAYALGAFGARGGLDGVDIALLVVGAVPIVLGLLVGTRLRPGPWWLGAGLVAGGSIALIAIAVNAAGGEFEDRSTVRLITAGSLPVAEGQSAGTVGVAVTDDGDVAELNVKDKKLSALGLDRAGVYTGKVDLSRGSEGGEAKSTINVRDWWPWAFLMLSLGVGLGYLVRHYFEKRRPHARGRRDANREWQLISDADSEWHFSADGKPYVTYEWIELAQEWRAEIDRLLEQDEAKDATTQIKNLGDFRNGFERLRSRLIELDTVAAKLAELWRSRDFGIADRAHVDPLRLADEMLDDGEHFAESLGVSTAAGSLEVREKTVAERIELCDGVRRVLAEIIDQLGLTDELDRGIDEDPVAPIATELVKIARQVLHAKTINDVTEAEKLLEPQQDPLQALANTPRLDMALLEALPAGRVIDVGGQRRFLLTRNLTPSATAPKATIHCSRYSSTETSTACSGDADDLFALTARISDAGSARSSRVAWNFGDGSAALKQIAVLSDGEGEVTARHQFDAGGRRTVRLAVDGNEVASREIELSDTGLAARTAARFTMLDREMTLLAGLIAVGSGMLAVYFSDAGWGEPDDYVKALLWGAVVSEGVKLAGALVSRAWPGS